MFQRIASESEIACSALVEEFGVKQATISHHLRELHEAGLITVRREAKFMHIKVNRAVWRAYVSALRRLTESQKAG